MNRKLSGLLVMLLVASLAAGGWFGWQKFRSVALAKGSEVRLLLVTPLEAGGTKSGDAVQFVVAEDVRVKDAVVIAKGSAARGEVTNSRGEGMLSGLTNQPARLEVKVTEITAADGTKIPSTTVYSFNRGNTGRTEVMAKIERLLGSENTKAAMEGLRKRIESGENIDLNSPEMKKSLAEIGNELGIEELADAATSGKASELADTVRMLRSGASLLDGGLSLGGALQVINVVDQAGKRLDRMLRGRTIRAHPGTPLNATTADKVNLRPN
jgi:hypothetical protein